MAVKYHFNPEGKPTKCTAKEGSCPFGTPSTHFETLEAAQEYADRKNFLKSSNFYEKAHIKIDSSDEGRPVSKNSIDLLPTADLEVIAEQDYTTGFGKWDIEQTEAYIKNATTIMEENNSEFIRYNSGEYLLGKYAFTGEPKPPEAVTFNLVRPEFGLITITLDIKDNDTISINYESDRKPDDEDIPMNMDLSLYTYFIISQSDQYKWFEEDLNEYKKEKEEFSLLVQKEQNGLKEADELEEIPESAREIWNTVVKHHRHYTAAKELNILSNRELKKRNEISTKLGQAVLEKTTISPQIKYGKNNEIVNLADYDGNRIISIDKDYPYQDEIGIKPSEFIGGYTVRLDDGTTEYRSNENYDKNIFDKTIRSVYVLETTEKTKNGGYFNYPKQ